MPTILQHTTFLTETLTRDCGDASVQVYDKCTTTDSGKGATGGRCVCTSKLLRPPHYVSTLTARRIYNYLHLQLSHSVSTTSTVHYYCLSLKC